MKQTKTTMMWMGICTDHCGKPCYKCRPRQLIKTAVDALKMKSINCSNESSAHRKSPCETRPSTSTSVMPSRHTQAPRPSGWLQALVLLLLAIPSVQGQSGINGQCYGHLFAADADQNNFLSQTEFADSVRRVTYGAVDGPFTSLPPSLLTTFATRSQGGSGIPIQGTSPGSTPTAAQRDLLDGVCDAIMEGVLSALGVTVAYSRCYLNLFIGDQSRDQSLSREEFPRYANPMSGNKYGVLSFDELPQPLQLVFDDFAGPGGVINVQGTRPGTRPTTDQEPILQSLCRQTLVAVEAAENSQTLAPTETPKAFDFTFRFCATVMAAADQNQDAQMDEQDYARFVNTVSGNEYPARVFDRLPDILQQSFITKANALGVVDIRGARPNTPRSPEQESNLQSICDDTKKALNDQANAPPPPPTPAPTRGPVEAIPYIQCTLSMAISDSDLSNSLTEEEYVLFLNKVQAFEWRNVPYAEIPRSLQLNFESFAAESTTPGMDITGSRPGSPPSTEQRGFLEKICYDTAVAIENALYPKPTPSPIALPPGGTRAPTFSGNVTVYNAFIISTTPGSSFGDVLPDASDEGNANRKNLEVAYADFVTDTVDSFLSSRTRRRLRGLSVNGVVEGSQGIDEIQDTDCPASTDRPACRKVYGSFDVDLQDEPNTDMLQEQLTKAVQSALNRTEGGLQSFLEQVQSDSPILVVGPPEDGSLRPTSLAPAASPTEPPSSSRSGDDGGISTGLLIGVIIGGVILCCCCIFLVYSIDEPLSFLKRTGGGKRKETEDIDHPFDDELPGPTGLGGALGLYGSTKPEGGEQESLAGFSIQEQSPAAKTSRFGFGRKSKDSALGPAPIHDGQDSVADYDFDDASKVGVGVDDDRSHIEPAMGGGDWNPQRPPDPWDDRRRESSSSGSGSRSESGSEDSDTGYGSSDSDEDEDAIFRDERRGPEDEDSSSGEGDYDDDYDDDYEDNPGFGDEQTMESETYRGEDTESLRFNASDALGTEEFDNMVDEGNWSGVMKTNENVTNDSIPFGDSSGFGESAAFGDSGFGGGPVSPNLRPDRAGSRGAPGTPGSGSRGSSESEDSRRREYLERVRELVAQVVPDEVDNVPAMMEQFAGREEELINTLQTMYERSTSSRARKAVHRSKGIPDESGRFTAGSADGTAAVAAASTIGQGFDSSFRSDSHRSSQQDSYAQGSFHDDDYDDYGSRRSYDEDDYGDEHSGSYSGHDDEYGDDYDDEYDDDHDDQDRSHSQQSGFDSYGQGSYSQASYSRGSFDGRGEGFDDGFGRQGGNYDDESGNEDDESSADE